MINSARSQLVLDHPLNKQKKVSTKNECPLSFHAQNLGKFLGYKLGLRSLLGKGKHINITGKIDRDLAIRESNIERLRKFWAKGLFTWLGAHFWRWAPAG